MCVTWRIITRCDTLGIGLPSCPHTVGHKWRIKLEMQAIQFIVSCEISVFCYSLYCRICSVIYFCIVLLSFQDCAAQCRVWWMIFLFFVLLTVVKILVNIIIVLSFSQQSQLSDIFRYCAAHFRILTVTFLQSATHFKIVEWYNSVLCCSLQNLVNNISVFLLPSAECDIIVLCCPLQRLV